MLPRWWLIRVFRREAMTAAQRTPETPTPPVGPDPHPDLLEIVNSESWNWTKTFQYTFIVLVRSLVILLLVLAGVLLSRLAQIDELWGAVAGPLSGYLAKR